MSYPRNLNIPLPPRSLNRERGVVIIVALFMVALVASMAYYMMGRLSRDIEQTTLMLQASEAAFLAEGSIAFARDHLRADWEHQRMNQVIDALPFVAPTKQVNGFQIKTSIEDLQSRYNLNYLMDAVAIPDFQRLIRAVFPTISEGEATRIARATHDFVTPILNESEFDRGYLAASPAYRAAHRPMQSVSELRLVRGMSPALYQALLPFVSALPKDMLINLQTAPWQVLMTLSAGMTPDIARAIVQMRTQKVLTGTEAFYQSEAVSKLLIPPEKVTVSSSYFLVETVVSKGEQTVVLYTILERLTNKNKAIVNVIGQAKGVKE